MLQFVLRLVFISFGVGVLVVIRVVERAKTEHRSRKWSTESESEESEFPLIPLWTPTLMISEHSTVAVEGRNVRSNQFDFNMIVLL